MQILSRLFKPFRTFVRNSPQYQHMPNSNFLSPLWRLTGGWLYFFKQALFFGVVTFVRTRPLKKYRNTNLGSPALVIGNGPSQKNLTLGQIKHIKSLGGKIFVMNSFDKTHLSGSFSPDFYFLLDPAYDLEGNVEKKTITEFLSLNSSTTLILSSLSKKTTILHPKRLYINGIQAVGLTKFLSPLLPNGHPQGVVFSALKVAKFLGHSPIYVTGVDQSHYLHHRHNQLGEVIIVLEGLHSYTGEPEGEIGKTIPYLTRNMGDVLYAQAVLLRDLRAFASKVPVVNVGISDFTNDSFPFGCLLPKDIEPM
jgi:hypothetical protein